MPTVPTREEFADAVAHFAPLVRDLDNLVDNLRARFYAPSHVLLHEALDAQTHVRRLLNRLQWAASGTESGGGAGDTLRVVRG